MNSRVLYYCWIIFSTTTASGGPPGPEGPPLGVRSQLGKLFLLQFPCLSNGTADAYMLTMSEQPVNVRVGTASDLFNVTVARNICTKFNFGKLTHTSCSGIERVFKLVSDQPMAVYVVITSSWASMETFRAVPYESFGRYYFVITLRTMPFICVVTHEMTFILVKLRTSGGASVSLEATGMDAFEKFHVTHEVYLDREQAFILTYCMSNNDPGAQEDFTGTEIMALADIGVISGNCAPSNPCRFRGDTANGGVVAEMLFPQQTYGREFLTFFVSKSTTPGLVTVIASFENTTVSIFENMKINEAMLLKPGDSSNYPARPNKAQRLFADHPIAVFLSWPNRCLGEGIQLNPALVNIVPVHQFHNIYLISLIPDVPNWAVFFLPKAISGELVVNSRPFPNMNWYKVEGSDDWIWSHVKLSSLVMSVRTHRYSYFGCYHFTDIKVTALTAGFRASRKLWQCRNSSAKVPSGDGIDNDCDGTYDEEAYNGEDDDNDGLTDEDLIGFPFECPPKIFGHSCNNSCYHCLSTCDTITGYCDGCEIGYYNHFEGCQEDCPSMTFGQDCNNDCFEKCGGDCVDRINGTCLAKAIRRSSRTITGPSFWIFLGFFFPAIIIIVIYFGITWYKRSTQVNASGRLQAPGIIMP